MTSSTSETALDAKGRVLKSGLLTGTLMVTVLLYAGLFILFLGHPISSGVFMAAFCAFYFWVDIGLFAAILVLLITYHASGRILPERRHRVRLRLQLSAITFAAVGIALMAMAPLIGYFNLQMGGYELHTRIWLDADRVGAWANRLDVPARSPISPLTWPLSLMVMAIPAGDVDVDETGNVTVCHGSALSGHWGVHITARGGNWTGERWADNTEYDRIKKIGDGVWIWRSMN